VSHEGVATDPEKVIKMLQWPTPLNKQELPINKQALPIITESLLRLCPDFETIVPAY